MQSLRQLGAGFVLAFASFALVIGAFSLSMLEGGLNPIQAVSPSTIPNINTPVLLPTLPPIPAAGITETATQISSPSPTASLPPPPTNCPPPTGWQAIILLPFDTLENLSSRYLTSPTELILNNCLISNTLMPGSILYVPANRITNTATTSFSLPSATLIPCGAPIGWTGRYQVQTGDTLFKISGLYRVTVNQIQLANCMGNNTQITPGQLLIVPNVATSTITVTPLVLIFASNTATLTNTATLPASPTALPTFTASPSPAPSATTAPSATSVPTPTTQP